VPVAVEPFASDAFPPASLAFPSASLNVHVSSELAYPS
jgi:hypothetical protein